MLLGEYLTGTSRLRFRASTAKGKHRQFHGSSAKLKSFPRSGRPDVYAASFDCSARVSHEVFPAERPGFQLDSSAQRQNRGVGGDQSSSDLLTAGCPATQA